MTQYIFQYQYIYDANSTAYLQDLAGGTGYTVERFGDLNSVLSPGEKDINAGFTYIGQTQDGGAVFEFVSFPVKFYIYATNTPGPAPATLPGFAQVDYAPCFVPGTRIATPTGEVPVEALAIGDEILGADGKAVRVKWLGHRTLHPAFAASLDAMPIRIAAGALGEGLPKRDLLVSPDHAMLVEGCLVHAGALVNGRSITQLTGWQGDLQYLHIETEAHQLILAEGAATETYIDHDTRRRFDNHAEYVQLYPDEAQAAEPLDLPRVCFKRQLSQKIVAKLARIADEQMPSRRAA